MTADIDRLILIELVSVFSTAINSRPGFEGSDTWQLVFGISLTYVLTYALGKIYISCSESLSNKYSFSRLFPLISTATCLIIFVVKSSLALSLGLVGALSIVRFRTAIKDPEELIFLFVSIGLGLASGAGQYLAALVGFIMISLGSYVLKLRKSKSSSNNLFRINVDCFDSAKIMPLVEIFKKHTQRVDIGHLLTSNKIKSECSINFSISIRDIQKLVNLKEELNSTFPDAKFNFIELKSI